MEDTIYGLSNEAYHNEKPYSDYLSSSQLKHYLHSPKFAKFMLDNPQPQTDAMKFGSLFHDCMGALAAGGQPDEILDAIAVFEPPTNAKTGQPYGATSKAYKEAYESFVGGLNGTLVSSAQDKELAGLMMDSVLNGCGSTSVQVRKLLRWGKPEVSHFIEYKGCKFKWRPDLETGLKIVDWKTVATNDLSEKSINNIISRYGYDISAAMYLFFEHERTGVWKTFYWIFVSKEPPYDAVLVDASQWTYSHYDEYGVYHEDIIIPKVGAIKFQKLLDLHIKCTKENNYPGAEINIPKDEFGRRIMLPTPPSWEVNLASEILYNE